MVKESFINWFNFAKGFKVLGSKRGSQELTVLKNLSESQRHSLNLFFSKQKFSEASGGDGRVFLGFNDPDIPAEVKICIKGAVSQLNHELNCFGRDELVPGLIMLNVVEPRHDGVAVSSGNGWHRDSFGWQHKVFMYLTDVDEQTGALEVIPGTQLFWKQVVDLALNTFLCRSPSRFSVFLGRTSQIIVGKAGFVFAANTAVVHRGRPIERGVRKAITVYLYARQDFTLDRYAKVSRKFGVQKCVYF